MINLNLRLNKQAISPTVYINSSASTTCNSTPSNKEICPSISKFSFNTPHCDKKVHSIQKEIKQTDAYLKALRTKGQ